jgi:hypothetical protein
VPTNHVRAVLELLRTLTIGQPGKRVVIQVENQVMTQVGKPVLGNVGKQVTIQVGLTGLDMFKNSL